MFEKPQQPTETKETTMKKESPLKKLGKVAMLSAGLLIGAQAAEAGDMNKVRSHADDLFNELDKEQQKGMHESHKQTPSDEQKNITSDKKSGDMFEAMDKLGALDEKYASAKTEQEKDVLRQQIAKAALMSGKSGKILSQKDGSVGHLCVGGWTISAQSDGHIVAGSIAHDGGEKSMFAFLFP